MIRVYLAKKRKTDLRQSPSGQLVKDFPWRKLILPLGVAIFAFYLLESYKSEEIEKVGKEMAQLLNQKKEIQNQIENANKGQVDEKSILELEQKMRTEIIKIQDLSQNREMVSQVFNSISQAIPPEVWLESFQMDKSKILIQGASLDFQKISDFMKDLGKNDFFSGIELKNSQKKVQPSGFEVAQFELQKVRQ